MSPSSITRSPISWCGFAPLGPDATTVKSTREWPCRSRSSARSAASSVSFRPANRSSRRSVKAASTAAPAAAMRAELLVVLDRAQQRERLGHRHVRGSGQALLQAEHVHGPRRVGDGVAPVRVQERGRRVIRVAPVAPIVEREHRCAGRALGVRTLERRDDHRRLACRRDDEHRQPLGDGHGHVAREVRQVWAGRHEGARKSRLLGRAGRPRPPRSEVLGGEVGHGKADGTRVIPPRRFPLATFVTICKR